MTAIDFKESVAPLADPANKETTGRVSPVSVRMGMFTSMPQAKKHADLLITRGSFPPAEISFPVNREKWDVYPGMAFRLRYPPYGIEDMVYRVSRVQEEAVDSDEIKVIAALDMKYFASFVELAGPVEGGLLPVEEEVEDILYADFLEAPYVLVGADLIFGIPLAARRSGAAKGYLLYVSKDGGTSYEKIKQIKQYNPYGTLVNKRYKADTDKIDDDVGFEVDFVNDDVGLIETITRSQLLGQKNIALLGSEMISFQTITPVSGYTNRYRIEGIYRGRIDTEQIDHYRGESFWFIGDTQYTQFENYDFTTGAELKFKYVPYTERVVGDISTAPIVTKTITGRALTPYRPINLQIESQEYRAIYTAGADIDLDWSPRVRGLGSGVMNPLTFPDGAISWEGNFRVKVYGDGSLVRTTSSINDDSWTYTNAMNVADNGAGGADLIEFHVTNYRVVDGVEYESAPLIAKVQKTSWEFSSTTTTTTTTSTTTTVSQFLTTTTTV